ncbi:MAG: capsule biosynthesis protein [Bacteroidales bacterium]|nr:capsule biosynthesis protein [Bacteroidales bacterium]
MMSKKLILPLFLLFVAQFVCAQKPMNSDDVVKYILVERSNGASDQTIKSRLLQRGISSSDYKNAIKEIEDLGGSFVFTESATGEGEVMPTRLRSNNETQQPEEVQNAGAENLEVEENVMPKNMVFGRDIFNNKMLTFAPSVNVPTPGNYILGAGDQVIVDVWGASQETIDDYISPDGFLVIEGVGPLKLAGKSVNEANEFVKSRLGDVYNNSEIALTLGTMRSINVQVVGDVVTPGTYTINALSTSFNALYAAGGISDVGTLRSIAVYRNSKKIAEIDVYDYLFAGNSKGNVLLQDNDVISVGSYQSLVNIQGRVKRPMIYEMNEGETFSKLLGYVGGFSNDAYTENIRLVRKSGKGYSVHTLSKSDFSSFTLNDGDSIYVDSIVPRYSNMVEIAGAVFYPGHYELGKDVKTFKDLVKKAGGLLEEAFLERAVLQHCNFDGTRESQPVDVRGVMNGTVPDFKLQNNDLIFIPSTAKMRGQEYVAIVGEVRLPGKYIYAENLTVEDAILLAGGITPSASISKIDVYRRLYNPSALESVNEITEVYSLAVKDGFVIEDGTSFVLKPYDEIVVRKSPVYNNKQTVKISGCVNFAGDFAIVNNNYRLSDLVKDAKGFTGAAYPAGTRLYRKMTEEELHNLQIVLERERVRIMEENIDSKDQASMELLDSILGMKFDAQTKYLVAIDIEEAMKKPGGEADLLLKEGDVVVVPEYTGTVKVSGEVFHPVTMSYNKGENKKYYIKRAGGYANNAKKRGAYVVYMNGSVKKLSRKSSDIQPGCEIIIPTKGPSRFSISDVTGIATSTLSMAAVVASLINNLNK